MLCLKGENMLKKLIVVLCLLFLFVGIVSAADINSTDDTLKIDDNAGDEIVKNYNEDVLSQKPESTITIKFVNIITGEEYGSQTNTISEGSSWGITMVKFNNMIANHRTFKSDGYKYTFTYWTGENGIVDTTQRFYCTGEDYTVIFYANYDKELLGRLIFILNDEHGHNGHYMTYNDEADYQFTFKEPVDVEEGYLFMHYVDADTGEIYHPGDNFSIKYSEFKGHEKTVEINAVYEKIVDNNTENETIIDNNADENETQIGNGTDEISQDTSNTKNNTKIEVNKNNISDDNNITTVLSSHKTGTALVGFGILVIIIISILIYNRRLKN